MRFRSRIFCENVRLTVGAKRPVPMREIWNDYVACALHPLRSFDSLTSFAHVICAANRGVVLILRAMGKATNLRL